MNLLPLLKRLETMRVGKQGVNLFAYMLPAENTQGVLLRTFPGMAKVNAELPGFVRARFQMIVRSQDVLSGYNLIKQAMDAITFEGETVLGPQKFNFCRPMFLPVPYPVDSAGMIEHVAGFEACYVET